MRKKLLALIGESGSGKNTVQKVLQNKYGMSKIVTYTTRPKRTGERDGIDYHFVSDREVNLST